MGARAQGLQVNAEPDADYRWWLLWWSMVWLASFATVWSCTDDRDGALVAGSFLTMFYFYLSNAVSSWRLHWHEKRRATRRRKERDDRLARRTPEEIANDEKCAALARSMGESLYGTRPTTPSGDDYFDGLGKLEGDDDGR